MRCGLLIVLIASSLLVNAPCSASEPSSDEIPIIGQRFAPWGWSPLLLCQLAWSHFDGFEVQLAAEEASIWSWSDGPIQELWLTFQMGKPHPTTSDPQIRLSWVRLEESGD